MSETVESGIQLWLVQFRSQFSMSSVCSLTWNVAGASFHLPLCCSSQLSGSTLTKIESSHINIQFPRKIPDLLYKRWQRAAHPETWTPPSTRLQNRSPVKGHLEMYRIFHQSHTWSICKSACFQLLGFQVLPASCLGRVTPNDSTGLLLGVSLPWRVSTAQSQAKDISDKNKNNKTPLKGSHCGSVHYAAAYYTSIPYGCWFKSQLF